MKTATPEELIGFNKEIKKIEGILYYNRNVALMDTGENVSYSEEEIQFLENNYLIHGAEYCSEKLGRPLTDAEKEKIKTKNPPPSIIDFQMKE